MCGVVGCKDSLAVHPPVHAGIRLKALLQMSLERPSAQHRVDRYRSLKGFDGRGVSKILRKLRSSDFSTERIEKR